MPCHPGVCETALRQSIRHLCRMTCLFLLFFNELVSTTNGNDSGGLSPSSASPTHTLEAGLRLVSDSTDEKQMFRD